MKKKLYNLVVVGLGYVGLPLALLAREKGMGVVGIDIDARKLDLINRGICPFKNYLLMKKLKKFPLKASSNFQLIANSDVIIICVPSPVKKNHLPDLSPIKKVGEHIGKYIKNGHVVVLESTVNPGVTRDCLIATLEKKSGLKVGKDFSVSHCPERINPGDPFWTVDNVPRVVGSFDKKGLSKTVRFYRSLLNSKIVPMASLEEAEAVKIMENCFRDINIAFINEMAMSFQKIGIDIMHVIKGASEKPYGFLTHYPSCGVGGHCIPVDPYYLINYAKKHGFNHRILKLARRINDAMPEYTVNLLKQSAKTCKRKLRGMTVAIFGIAYKGNTDDVRGSPALEIINILNKKNVKTRIYDPYLLDKSYARSIKTVLKGCDAVIICSNHDEFKKLTPKIIKKYNIQIIVDGKNCLNKNDFVKENIIYRGIGR